VKVVNEEETLKLFSDCSEQEKMDNGIVEKDGIIYVKT
jgi:hypothetical protein